MTYSSSISINRQKFAARNQNFTAVSAKAVSVGPISNTIILIVLGCLLGLLYLTQVTKTNSFSYQINNLQQQQNQLQTQHDQLEVDSASLQSVQRVANSNVSQQMVNVTPVATAQN